MDEEPQICGAIARKGWIKLDSRTVVTPVKLMDQLLAISCLWLAVKDTDKLRCGGQY
jgi:hypothetical protein